MRTEDRKDSEIGGRIRSSRGRRGTSELAKGRMKGSTHALSVSRGSEKRKAEDTDIGPRAAFVILALAALLVEPPQLGCEH